MLFFELQPYFLRIALGFARIAPVFYFLPFLNDNQFGGQLTKNAVIAVVALGLSFLLPMPLAYGDGLSLLALLLHEVLIGFALGVMLACPFWLVHAIGSMIDNQRGATISSTMSPLTGIDTPELANFFSLLAATIYLQGGGMLLVLQALQASYRLFPLQGSVSLALPAALALIDHLVGRALLLASPVLICLLLTEVLLGVLSRFAQQLNAFSMAMTVKSLVAFALLLLYFVPTLQRMMAASHDLGTIMSLLH